MENESLKWLDEMWCRSRWQLRLVGSPARYNESLLQVGKVAGS